MNVLAIMGSYHRTGTINTLMDQAIAGVRSGGDVQVDKITLIDQRIEYCRNCLTCRADDPEKPLARCAIDDDMTEIYRLVEQADGFIFGTPVNMAHVTAVMKTFLERLCWVCAKPGRWPLPGCPTPRITRPRRAIAIVSAGVVPVWLRRFCDDATVLIKQVCRDSLNARLVGSLYAGAVEKRGTQPYDAKAFALGRKLIP